MDGCFIKYGNVENLNIWDLPLSAWYLGANYRDLSTRPLSRGVAIDAKPPSPLKPSRSRVKGKGGRKWHECLRTCPVVSRIVLVPASARKGSFLSGRWEWPYARSMPVPRLPRGWMKNNVSCDPCPLTASVSRVRSALAPGKSEPDCSGRMRVPGQEGSD